MFEFCLSLWVLDVCGFVDLRIGLFSVATVLVLGFGGCACYVLVVW